MKIGEVARRTGLKVETVRFYEAEGLVGTPTRSGGNYRIYDSAQLDRLSFIRRARDLGFTLDQVRSLVRLTDDLRAPCAEIDHITAAHIEEVDRKLADLTALRSELVRTLASCPGSTVADCQVLVALAPRKVGANGDTERTVPSS